MCPLDTFSWRTDFPSTPVCMVEGISYRLTFCVIPTVVSSVTLYFASYLYQYKVIESSLIWLYSSIDIVTYSLISPVIPSIGQDFLELLDPFPFCHKGRYEGKREFYGHISVIMIYIKIVHDISGGLGIDI